MFVGFKSARSRNDLCLCPSSGQLVDDFFEYGIARRVSEQNQIMLCDFVLTDFCIKCHPGMLPKLLTPVFDSVFQFGCGSVFDPLMSGIARGFDKDKGVEFWQQDFARTGLCLAKHNYRALVLRYWVYQGKEP